MGLVNAVAMVAWQKQSIAQLDLGTERCRIHRTRNHTMRKRSVVCGKSNHVMKKFLVLAPFFLFAACGGIDKVNLGTSAGAGEGGAGGESALCQCANETDLFSGSRLKVALSEGTDGSRVNTGHFIDSKTGLVCSFQKLPNGETRCVPEHVALNTFSDEFCQIPIYLVAGTQSGCGPKLPVFARFDLRDGTECSSKINGFRIGSANTSEPKTVTTWRFLDENGSCVGRWAKLEQQVVAYSVHVLGGEDDFVKATTPE